MSKNTEIKKLAFKHFEDGKPSSEVICILKGFRSSATVYDWKKKFDLGERPVYKKSPGRPRSVLTNSLKNKVLRRLEIGRSCRAIGFNNILM